MHLGAVHALSILIVFILLVDLQLVLVWDALVGVVVDELQLDVLFAELLLGLGSFFDGANAEVLGFSAGAIAAGWVHHGFILFDDLALDLERQRVRQVVKQLKFIFTLRLEVLELILLVLIVFLFVVFLVLIVVVVVLGSVFVAQGKVGIPGLGSATFVPTPGKLLHCIRLLRNLGGARSAVHARRLSLSKGTTHNSWSFFLYDACHLGDSNRSTLSILH